MTGNRSVLPETRAISPREVHVWRVSLDRPVPAARLAAQLDAAEQLRAGRFRFARDRNRFTVSHASLRLILGRYLEAEPGGLTFRFGPQGKPELVDPTACDLRFNLSHSGDLAVIALASGRNIGVDVEHVRPVAEWPAIAGRVLSPQERTALHALPPDAHQEAFFRSWTRKEAVLKATGDGVHSALDRIDVLTSWGGLETPYRVDTDPLQGGPWYLQDLTPAPAYVGAVAAEGAGWRLRLFEW